MSEWVCHTATHGLVSERGVEGREQVNESVCLTATVV